MPGLLACTYNLSTGHAETGGSLGLTDQPAYPSLCAPGPSDRFSLKKQDEEAWRVAQQLGAPALAKDHGLVPSTYS